MMPRKLSSSSARSSSTLLIALLTFSKVRQCLLENHYCPTATEVTVRLDNFQHSDATFIPQTLDSKKDIHTVCKWTVDIQLEQKPAAQQQIIMQVSSAKNGNRSFANPPKIKITNEFGFEEEIETGTFSVFPAKLRRKFKISVSWEKDAGLTNRSSAKVRVILPIQTFCGKDMLSFNGSCYAVSAVKQNVTAAMSSIKGDAQLASFFGMAEICEFIGANKARLERPPYRRPLRLDQPVRLGMFYGAAEAAVLFVVRSDMGCQLQPVSNSAYFRLSGRVADPCLSLSVAESDRAVVEFCDCSSTMLSLLSFPETARTVPSSAHCNGSELANLMEQLLSHPDGTSTIPEAAALTSRSDLKTAASSIKVAVPACVGVLVLAGVAMFAYCMARRCRERRNERSRPSGQSDSENFDPAAEKFSMYPV